MQNLFQSSLRKIYFSNDIETFSKNLPNLPRNYEIDSAKKWSKDGALTL